ncbi:alpha/beta hydrolase [Serinicoccus kebangsaanensis]|uniref:alpha/beta hydrolase n=1 Tax=Serinicoccus kebangsaanensis TaxID=2602069 RepID=UPI00124E7878|nr:alpha/beta fold hydrolase [Serinicoccus kebangsaanensis]
MTSSAAPAPRRDGDNPHLASGAESWGEEDAPVAVLAVHGRTQSPADMRALAERLDVEGLRWLAPAAAGQTWYPYGFMEERPDDDPWLAWSLEVVDRQLDRLTTAGYPPEKVVLLGFSQGACLLAHWALLHPARYAGLVILTGGYVGTERESVSFSGDFDATPALLAGREADPWVPRTRMAQTEEWLRGMGARLTSLVEPGDEHQVTTTATELTARLLRHTVSATARR